MRDFGVVRTDERTGVEVVQLTTRDVMNYHQYCYGQWITGDERTLLYFSPRELIRQSPVDLWCVNADGTDSALLVEGGLWSTISPDNSTVYSGVGNRVVAVPLAKDRSGTASPPIPRTVFESDTSSLFLINAISRDGRYLFCQTVAKAGGMTYTRIDLRDGSGVELFRTQSIMHLQLHDGEPGYLLASVIPPEMEYGIYTFDFDGKDFRKLPFIRSTNHYASLGRTGYVITSVHNPDRKIEIARPGDAHAEVLVEGPGFWHPTSDESGEWIASDTNWPDTGLYLIHAPSGRHRVLCYPDASCGHPQWTHAHPRMSPCANYVVFDSDRYGGISHVFAARIPSELKSALREGTE